MENHWSLRAWVRRLSGRKESGNVQIPLVAFFWNGSVPKRYEVRKVTLDSAYVVTDDKWYPGTILTMTFQYDPYYLQVAPINGNGKASLRMRAKIVDFGHDGVGVRFIFLNKDERRRFECFLSGAEVRGVA